MITIIDFIEFPSAKNTIIGYDKILEQYEKQGIHNSCDCCGRQIRNVFLIYDSENNKKLCLGSECVKTYSPNGMIKNEIKETKKFKKVAKKIRELKLEDVTSPF